VVLVDVLTRLTASEDALPENDTVATTEPAPAEIEYVRVFVLPPSVPEVLNVTVAAGLGEDELVGDADGELVGVAVGLGAVLGDHAGGATDSSHKLDAAFQCVARYEPAGGFVEK
jgi:hypothetical protein